MQNSSYINLAINPHPLIVAPDCSVFDAVKCINQSSNFKAITTTLRSPQSNLNPIFVVEENRLIGIFTTYELLLLIEQQVDLQQTKLVDLPQSPLVVIRRSQIQTLDQISSLLKTLSNHVLPVVDDFGQLLGFVTPETLLIAQNKLIQDNLNNVEAQKRLILNAIPALIYRVSSHGIYLEGFASNYVADLFSPNFDPTGKRLVDVLPQELAERKLQAIQQAIATGEIQIFEQQWNINGKIQYEEVQVVKVGDHEALTIIQNIGDRKQAESTLRESEMGYIRDLKFAQQELSRLNQDLEIRIKQRTADLMASETRKQAILNAIPDLLLRLKVDGTCLDCILPRLSSKEAFVPIKHSISEVLSPSVFAEQLTVFKRAIATGEVQIYEHKLQKYDRWVYEEARISPCGEDEVLVLIRNVSDRKQAEESLRLTNEKLISMNHELERVTRLKDEFLATMSHELRTPLNAILGISEGLLEQVFGEMNQRQQNSLATIQRSGKHLLDLINDVLDVAKIEAGMFSLDLTSVSVKNLCDSSLSFVKHQSAQKNIQVNLVIDPNMSNTIFVDDRRIRQILINLLSNAVKFTPNNGKVTLKVNLENAIENPLDQESKSYICFSVSDTGIGIDQKDIHKLFQPFTQIDSSLSRQYAGTGLGLNLVKKLTELHGGQVSVDSKLAQGSCFSVRIPCQNSL